MGKYSITEVVRIGLIVVVVGLVVALFVYDAALPTDSETTVYEPWNSGMLIGSADAPNHLIEYTDYFCSFCSQFHDAITDEFTKTYIDTGKLSYETRVVDLLSGVSVNTPMGNEAAYCAAEQDKYWEYSDELMERINTDYFSKGIGVKNVANPAKIPTLGADYFTEPASVVGLDVEQFSACLSANKYADEIETNSQRAVQLGVSGLPYIMANDYTASGFSGGGYDELKLILKAGGVE